MIPATCIKIHLPYGILLEKTNKKVYTGRDVNIVYTKKFNLGRQEIKNENFSDQCG
jgi:hypothetical protein